MTLGPRCAVPALVALLLSVQGCVVPASKYKKLEADRDRIQGLLDKMDSDLTGAQGDLRTLREGSAQKVDVYKKQATSSKDEADRLRAELEKAKKDKKTSAFDAEMRALGVGTVRDGRLVLQNTLLFSRGKATLTRQGQLALGKVARAFKRKKATIWVDGHTDAVPIVKPETKKLHVDNMGLSINRALAVYRYLRSQGIAESTMRVRGFGSGEPIIGGKAGSPKDRRVEILFVPAAATRRSRPG